MKPVWTLHLVKNQQRGAETTYTVGRRVPEQTTDESGAKSQASPQSWGRLSRVLEQVARVDAARMAMLKKELDSSGSVDLPEMALDSLDLRLIGFTDG
jgi:hypothetical protein